MSIKNLANFLMTEGNNRSLEALANNQKPLARRSQSKIKNYLCLLLVWICLPVAAQVDDGDYKGFKIIKNQDGPDIIDINVLSLGNKYCQFSEIMENGNKKPLDGNYHVIIHRNRYALANFSKGIANGDWEEYIGQELNVKCAYKDGKYDGKHFRYGPMGLENKYPTVSTYKAGVIQHRISYYDNGQVHEENFYDENGRQHGEVFTYDKDGNVTREERYLHGKYHGRQMKVDEREKTTSEYNMGVMVGEYCRLYTNGNIAYKGSYDENGKKTGKWLSGKENGNITKEAWYLDDKLHGEEREYFSNGLVRCVTEYANGKHNGKTTYYRESPHTISQEAIFADDKRLEYRFYDNGVLYQTDIYKDGNVVCQKVYERGKLRTIRLLNENGSLVNVEQYDNAGKRTYKNTDYKKHSSIKLKETASGVIDVEVE